MTKLSSKTVCTAGVCKNDILEAVSKFIAPYIDQVKKCSNNSTDGRQSDLKIVVKLYEEKKRVSSKEYEKIYAEEMAAAACCKGPMAWKGHGYRFLFSERDFTWHGKQLYVTSGEALFLYHWLMCGVKEGWSFFLPNLRARHGLGFLREVTG